MDDCKRNLVKLREQVSCYTYFSKMVKTYFNKQHPDQPDTFIKLLAISGGKVSPHFNPPTILIIFFVVI